MFVTGCGRSVDLAVQELNGASEHAVEDMRVVDSMHQEITADASENFFFVNPCVLLIRLVVVPLLPLDMTWFKLNRRNSACAEVCIVANLV